MSRDQVAGVFPGSFDPLTVAHLAIAEAAVRQAGLERLDFAISRVALAKDAQARLSVHDRIGALHRARDHRIWMSYTVTDDQLIADIARGYDAVVMGADKWAQVRDPRWYGSDTAARDAAVAVLPRVLVAPRPGYEIVGAEMLELDPALAGVSSTRAWDAGEHHLIAPGARRRLIVDGNNVIGSRPDGWWRDRRGAARRLVARLQAHTSRTREPIAVVLDGRPVPELPEGVHDGVLVAYTRRGGRDAADDRIIEEVARDRDPSTLTVVTSDRGLATRVRDIGARVEGAGDFIRELGWEPP